MADKCSERTRLAVVNNTNLEDNIKDYRSVRSELINMTIDHLRGVYGDRDIPGIEKMRQVTVTMALANPQMFSDNGVAKPRGYGKGGFGDLKALAAQMVDRMGKVARG